MKAIIRGRFALAVLLFAASLPQDASAESGEPQDSSLVDASDSPDHSNEVEEASFTTSTTSTSAGIGRRNCEPCRSCQQWVHRGDPSLTFHDWWRTDANRSISFGTTGSAGASEQLDLVSGFDSKRVWGLHSMVTDLDYFYSSARGAGTTKNRLYALTRYERAFYDTPYSWFVDSWFQYDQFEDFRVRIAYHTGLIRTWIKTDRQLFRTLAGLGAAKAFDGPNDQWKAEPEFGALYELRLNNRQKFYTQALYYPELQNASLFRLNVKVGWETKISDVRDIAIRIWAYNRYDNTDLVTANPNALDYGLSLVCGF